MAESLVNDAAVAHVRELIDKKQYVLESDWGQAQPDAKAQNDYLKQHSWDGYAAWHLGLTEGANEETKARYAFVAGDLRHPTSTRREVVSCSTKRPLDGAGRSSGQVRAIETVRVG
ncbi:MAG: hypothetical protein ABI112_18485 [Terracoccus sp.]